MHRKAVLVAGLILLNMVAKAQAQSAADAAAIKETALDYIQGWY